jgi:hypothetical protein
LDRPQFPRLVECCEYWAATERHLLLVRRSARPELVQNFEEVHERQAKRVAMRFQLAILQ